MRIREHVSAGGIFMTASVAAGSMCDASITHTFGRSCSLAKATSSVRSVRELVRRWRLAAAGLLPNLSATSA